MRDAVLVASKSGAQQISKVVDILDERNINRQICSLKIIGHGVVFESLIKGNNFQVKLIYVKPGGSISLQYHNHRSEHWVIVEGGKVTLDEETKH